MQAEAATGAIDVITRPIAYRAVGTVLVFAATVSTYVVAMRIGS